MLLLNPKNHTRKYPDERSREIVLKTIEFFENKGKVKLKEDDHERLWYADLIDFIKENKIFSQLITPEKYANGDPDTRWDTWRACEFNEVLGFYGLHYWYTWQVSILGLGPIFQSDNEAAKEKAAQYLREGGIFAFGLSEKEHGADVYNTDMILTPQDDGTYLANGYKYYIGNGNEAAMVSVFGKIAGTDEYVFFSVDSQHDSYICRRNLVNTQSYVSEFSLHEYPITEADILHRGKEAFYAALNTVNIGKYNLGWATIGICTHAFYESITHAANRNLYGMMVTDFPHVKQNFVDAYSRLVAMKLFGLRASDYMRVASEDDRRYLLYNPIVKMKVTTQGEEVINLLWDVIAARGFEGETYFEAAARDIRALPKLEGTVHVNVALIIKFMANYLFTPKAFDEVPTVDEPRDDEFLFKQGPTKGLGKIQFHDYNLAYDLFDLPNVNLFKEQINVFKEALMMAPPDKHQQRDIDFLLSVGDIFTQIAYGQLILENAKLLDVDPALVDQIFDFMVRDFSKYALQVYLKPSSSDAQKDYCMKMIRKAAFDAERYEKIWKEVHALDGAYEMNP